MAEASYGFGRSTAELQIIFSRDIGYSTRKPGRYREHSGRACIIDGLEGQYLSTEDRMYVMDTCGQKGLTPRFLAMGAVSAVQRSGASVRWGDGSPGVAAGGQYRLCWCSPAHLQNDSLAAAGKNNFTVPEFLDCNLAPSDSILPDVGFSKPAININKEVFPDPLFPTIANRSF